METSTEPSFEETRRVLTGLARGRFGGIAPERVADHVVAVTPGADFVVRRAALEALARRHGVGERDGLHVVGRPRARSVLGTYRTRRTGDGARGARPYTTMLGSVSPLWTSCGCPDFVRSSLGLCKHGLAVLQQLSSTGALEQAGDASLASSSRAPARLVWDPRHPLRGEADRLARLCVVGQLRLDGIERASGAPAAASLGDPRRRLALLGALEKAIERGVLEAEPAAVTLLANERTRAERRTEASERSSECMRSLADLGRKLYPYQREGVERFFATGRLLLADDMGLGKTMQAIAACHALHATRRIARGLLIVPASLKAQWKREWEATTDTPIAFVEGNPDERAALLAGTKRGFLVMGYEQLLRDLVHVKRFGPEIVVLDEAQRIKNWATKSAAYVKSLDPAYRLVLTGTPMENRFDELASIMDFVDDMALEPKWRLVPLHTVRVGNASRGVGGAQNLDTLRTRLAPAMVRRVRQEVLAQLPSRTDTRVPVEMTEAQRARHEELDMPIARLLSRTAKRPLTQPEFLQLMQLLNTQRMICNGLAQVDFEDAWPRCEKVERPSASLLDGLFMPKVHALRTLVEEIVVGQRRKAVVFSQWRRMLRLSAWSVRALLADAGMRAVFFTGAESPKLRERAIVDFHDDPAVTMMFLSDAGGVGLNLQRAATCCVNLELPWNPAVLEQRIGRIHRIGQAYPIDVYNLVAEGGIEGRIATLVGRKKAVFSSLFDGTTDEVRFDGDASFLESVKMLVAPVSVPQLADEPPDDTPAEDVGTDADAGTVADAGSPGPTDVAPQPPPTSAAGLSITRLADGALRIEAPPELAGLLADLLSTLSASLRSTRPLPPA